MKDFTNYNQAQALKELGFNEECFAFYLEDGTRVPASYSKEGTVYPSNTDLLPEWCTAPTYSQAFRFFREKYDLHVQIRKENYFQQSAYEYFHFDISRGRETDITNQEDLLNDIFDDCSQDIPGNHLNDEKYSKLVFERKFAFKTYEAIESYCLDKLIEIVKNEKN